MPIVDAFPPHTHVCSGKALSGNWNIKHALKKASKTRYTSAFNQSKQINVCVEPTKPNEHVLSNQSNQTNIISYPHSTNPINLCLQPTKYILEVCVFNQSNHYVPSTNQITLICDRCWFLTHLSRPWFSFWTSSVDSTMPSRKVTMKSYAL